MRKALKVKYWMAANSNFFRLIFNGIHVISELIFLKSVSCLRNVNSLNGNLISVIWFHGLLEYTDGKFQKHGPKWVGHSVRFFNNFWLCVVRLTFFFRQKFNNFIYFSKIKFIFQNIIYPRGKTPGPLVTPKISKSL